MPRMTSLLTIFMALMATVITADAQPRGGWEVLGEQRSRPGVESLTIDVPGRRAGRFDALKVGVRGGNILLLSLEVTFGNGDRQNINVRFPVTAGAETGPIDLNGDGRFIRSVEVRYGSLGFMGRPTVVVLGRPARAQPERPVFRDLGPRWDRLAVERVERERERDVIQLSRRDGRFDAILLRVRQSPIRLRRVRVVFGNGQSQDFDLPDVLRPGDTDALELRGRQGRFIDRIVLVYRDIGSPRRASVEVWGRQVQQQGFRDLGPNWSRISIERAEVDREQEIIPLSRADGSFDALLLRVTRSPVRVRRVRVVFGNNQRQDFNLSDTIRPGQEVGPLELRGRQGRFIQRIVLVHQDAGGGPRGRIELWGRQAGR